MVQVSNGSLGKTKPSPVPYPNLTSRNFLEQQGKLSVQHTWYLNGEDLCLYYNMSTSMQ